jgi:hypothetical protein
MGMITGNSKILHRRGLLTGRTLPLNMLRQPNCTVFFAKAGILVVIKKTKTNPIKIITFFMSDFLPSKIDDIVISVACKYCAKKNSPGRKNAVEADLPGVQHEHKKSDGLIVYNISH